MKDAPKLGGANSMFFRAPGFPELSAIGIPRPPDPLRNGALPPPTSFMPPAVSAPPAPKVFDLFEIKSVQFDFFL